MNRDTIARLADVAAKAVVNALPAINRPAANISIVKAEAFHAMQAELRQPGSITSHTKKYIVEVVVQDSNIVQYADEQGHLQPDIKKAFRFLTGSCATAAQIRARNAYKGADVKILTVEVTEVISQL